MLTSTALALVLSGALSLPGLPKKVVITEFLADNDEVILDEDGDSSDFIEVYNGSANPRNLSGWALTDDPGDNGKWIFPAVTLQPGERIVVFASGKDRTDPTGELHTNFGLDKGGEYLALVKKDGVTKNSEWNPFPLQAEDVSYGLDDDGLEAFFSTPSPGAANGSDGPQGVVADPVFTQARGFHDAPFTLALSTETADATIRYTTDGTPPTESVGIVYTGPFTVGTTTVVRAIGTKANFEPTVVVTHTYVFVDEVLDQPASIPGYPQPVYDVGSGSATAQHDYEMDPAVVDDPAYADEMADAMRAVPTLSVAVDPGLVFGGAGFYDTNDVEIPISMEILYAQDQAGSHQADAGIEGHSHVRLKRSLRINFKDEFGPSKLDSDLFQRGPLNGDTASTDIDKLVLRAGNNRSWARNWNPAETTYVLDEFFRSSQLAMSGFGSRGNFVHLYVNGLYWGLYNVVERPDAKWTNEYFGGKYTDWFAVNHGGHLSGDPGDFNWLGGGLTNKDMSVAGNYAQLLNFLDVEAFCDYLILCWWSGTGDWPLNNWYGGNRNDSSPLGKIRFRYFAWDGEWSWDAPFGFSNAGHRAHVHPDFHENKSGGPTIAKIWHSARANDEFMTLFHDRVYAHLFNGGALTDANARARFGHLAEFVESAVLGESARWGDALGGTTYERDVHWQDEVETIDGLMDGNGAVLIAALREEGYYPSIDPPVLSVHGGEVYSPLAVDLSNPNGSGTVHYTLDGADPREEGGAVSSSALQGTPTLNLVDSVTVRARVQQNGEWSALCDATFTFATSTAAVLGCGANPSGSLTHLYGAPEVGGQVVVGVDNPLGTQGAGSFAGLLVHVAPDANYPCGTLLPGLGMTGADAMGEMLVSLPLLYPLLLGPSWQGAGQPSPVELSIPADPGLALGAIYLQGAILDPFAAQGVAVGLTNGLELIVQP